jgi:hypothetical protein
MKEKLMKKKKHRGSSFDDFLKEEGIYEEVTARALKRSSIYELEKKVSSKRGMKSKMRAALNNSPSMVERVLSSNPHVEFDTLVRAGLSVGLVPFIEWIPVEKSKKLKKS